MDVLASHMGMANASDNVLKVELNSYSLENAGAAGAPLPDADDLRLYRGARYAPVEKRSRS